MVEKPVKRPKHYLSYLLRLWRENDDDSPLWRASLERPQDDERLVFASLADLFAFLNNETGLGLPDPECTSEGEK